MRALLLVLLTVVFSSFTIMPIVGCVEGAYAKVVDQAAETRAPSDAEKFVAAKTLEAMRILKKGFKPGNLFNADELRMLKADSLSDEAIARLEHGIWDEAATEIRLLQGFAKTYKNMTPAEKKVSRHGLTQEYIEMLKEFTSITLD